MAAEKAVSAVTARVTSSCRRTGARSAAQHVDNGQSGDKCDIDLAPPPSHTLPPSPFGLILSSDGAGRDSVELASNGSSFKMAARRCWNAVGCNEVAVGLERWLGINFDVLFYQL